MTDFSFTERTPEETGFKDVFNEKIAPFLKDIESERAAKHKNAKLYVSAGIAVAAILLLVADYYEKYFISSDRVPDLQWCSGWHEDAGPWSQRTARRSHRSHRL